MIHGPEPLLLTDSEQVDELVWGGA